MADEAEGGKHSGRSRFLSKTKWAKVFKENESPPAAGKGDVFKLNEDVTDFLKPSTDRVASTRPKINIAVAQRWPESHEVKRALETQGAVTSVNGWTKPRRREGLVVGFARTAPEVIGEGGDEAPDPPCEVSRMKSKVARSVSDPKVLDSRPDTQVQPSVPRPAQYARDHRLPGGPDDRRQGHGNGLSAIPALLEDRQQAQATMRNPRAANVPHDGSRPAPMRRAQTHNEFSPSLQRKHQSPPLEPVQPHRPSHSRTPTGLPEASDRQYTPSDEGLHHDLALPRPTINTSFGDDEKLATDDTGADRAPQQEKRDKYGMLSSSSTGGASPAIRRQRDMTNNEGMAFRRASAIYVTSESPTRDLNEGFQPPADFYDALSHAQADALSPPDSLSPTSTSSLGQSPFLGSKYIGRNPSEPAPAAKRASDGSKSSKSQIGPSPESPHYSSPDSSMLGPTTTKRNESSPTAGRSSPRPPDYFATPRAYQGQFVKSPMLNLRNEETARPGSAGSTNQGSSSPVPPARSDAGAELALADFAGRVAHMRGVFSLTAEKERSADECTPEAWLRTAIWWYLIGKAGLESLLAKRSKAREPQRELLMQPHVDLAMAFWIVTGPLEVYDMTEGGVPPNAQSNARTESLRQSVTLLMSYLRTLSASIQKSQLMPPSQSLIQGQDTTIWVDYPRFTADAATILGGSTSRALIKESPDYTPNALDVLPLGDTKDTFCYNRFQVQVTINTDDADTDRVNLPCIATMVRHQRDYQISLLVSSQSDLINIRIAPKHDSITGTTWHDVTWKANSLMLVVHLPRGFDVSLRMQERDFRSMWNLAEYSRKVESSLRPEQDEKLVLETRLTELQYADSSGTSVFPQEKVRGCSAMVYVRRSEHRDGSGIRKMHRGFRLLLVTSSGHKSLSYASHEVCRRSPLLFEFITDASANGTTAMILRVREERRQCRILLVFPDAAKRNALYEVLNGLTVGPDEIIVGKFKSAGVNIEPATQTEGFSPISHPALHALQWQKLGVTNYVAEKSNMPSAVESDNLRIIARHAGGCMTDWLNMGKGELLLRLPCSDKIRDKIRPSVQMLRQPQEDLTMSIDTRQCSQNVTDGISELLRLAQEQQTIRTYIFATATELHAFQAAVTGYTVKYDGIASTFAISRRMMVVSIHHKWQASNVRLQIVTQSNTTKILAFMEDFVHAEALCFDVKSIDTFESVKGDSKGKKWAVKLKEAKFSLPSKEKGELAIEDKVRRRFVNLEGLDYAEEHDDITIGFDTEEDRDTFARALPAATSAAGRGMSLRRRI
ncbi:hypothetical protein EJ03DRAFT_315196 [Teratosphaeria nubilosa]|uniref:Uncharacterized protein n=1 Tax=Teratosphaeria nubilosa TaxID=161662 RepID=A0A6G1L4L0_9PEZI|nr:hypothetical protein EJ03DRAFT_315196 [Teratosphaeria nubilosa]